MKLLRVSSFLVWALSGCNLLEADPATPDRGFGQLPLSEIEDVPAYENAVAEFIREVPYLQGYARGEHIWYWTVPGEPARFIAPMYRLFGLDGRPLDGPLDSPIIDAIPTNPGYTPWWRMFVVRVTPAYNNEPIWSREAIDAAVELGLVEPPEPTTMVFDRPVVHRDAKVDVGGGQFVGPTPVWYRGVRVHWLTFSSTIEVPVQIDGQNVREMPRFPVYVFRRIDEPLPLFEALTGTDITGDGQLNASNNIFAGRRPGDTRFSPLWWVAEVRTTPDFRSIDDPPHLETDLSAESQFLDLDDPENPRITSPSVLTVTPRPDQLFNCPIQPNRGSL